MLTRRVSQATAIITRTTTTNRRLIPSSRRHLRTNAPPMCPAFAAAWTRVWARPPLALQRNLEAEKQEKHENPGSSIHISLSTPPASLRATTTTAAAGCKTSAAPPAASRASSRTMVRWSAASVLWSSWSCAPSSVSSCFYSPAVVSRPALDGGAL